MNFLEVVAELREGRLLSELDNKIHELNQAVQAHDAAGSITLQLNITPKKGSSIVFVAAKLSTKLPQTAEENVFYVDPDSLELIRTTPRQATIEELENKNGSQ